jgi:hypothetical protein
MNDPGIKTKLFGGAAIINKPVSQPAPLFIQILQCLIVPQLSMKNASHCHNYRTVMSAGKTTRVL